MLMREYYSLWQKKEQKALDTKNKDVALFMLGIIAKTEIPNILLEKPKVLFVA